MTRKILALALALGIVAAFSGTSHAALSGADRTATPAPVETPAVQQAAVAVNPTTETVPAAAPAVTTAAPVAKPATPVAAPRKSVAQKVTTRRVAFRGGYPCH